MDFPASSRGYVSDGSSDYFFGQKIHPPSAISEGLVLPALKSETSNSQRHEVNPALALNLLKDIQTTIGVWQTQQRRLIQAMQALYDQGPMVDGWLQSSVSITSEPVQADSTLFRHGDADALMQYVEAMESSHTVDHLKATVGLPETPVAIPNKANNLPDYGETQYLLCTLSEDGRVRSQPCPPEQIALVSTAIARYQKFKQLMSQKQAVEAKLQQVVNQLTGVRASMRQE